MASVAESAAIHGVLQPEVEAGQYVRPGFSHWLQSRVHVNASICAFLKRRDAMDVSTQRFHRKARRQALYRPEAHTEAGNDPVALINETAVRNETTARAYLGVPVARLAERLQCRSSCMAFESTLRGIFP